MWINNKKKDLKERVLLRENAFFLLRLRYVDIETNLSKIILELETLSLASKKQQIDWWRFMLSKKKTSVILLMSASLLITEMSLLKQIYNNIFKKCWNFIIKKKSAKQAFSCIITLFIRTSQDRRIRITILKKHLKITITKLLVKTEPNFQLLELIRLLRTFRTNLKVFRKLILKKLLSQEVKPKLFAKLIVLLGFKQKERSIIFSSSLKYSLYTIKKLGSSTMLKQIFLKEISLSSLPNNNLWHEFFVSLVDVTLFESRTIYPSILYIMEFLCSCLHWSLILPIKDFNFPLLQTIKWLQKLADLKINKEILIYEYSRVELFTNVIFQLLHNCFYASLNIITNLQSILETKYFPLLFSTVKILVNIQIFTTLVDDVILLKKQYYCLRNGLNQLGINFALATIDFLIIIMKDISNLISLEISFFKKKSKEISILVESLKVISAFCLNGISVLQEKLCKDLESLILEFMFQIFHYSLESPFELLLFEVLISLVKCKVYRFSSLSWILLFFQRGSQSKSYKIRKLARQGILITRRSNLKPPILRLLNFNIITSQNETFNLEKKNEKIITLFKSQSHLQKLKRSNLIIEIKPFQLLKLRMKGLFTKSCSLKKYPWLQFYINYKKPANEVNKVPYIFYKFQKKKQFNFLKKHGIDWKKRSTLKSSVRKKV